MITIIAKIKLENDRKNDFIKEFATLRKSSLMEDGCNYFELAERFETELEFQVNIDNDTVYLHESWLDEKAFFYHLSTDHFKNFNTKMDGVILEASMQAIKPV